MEIWARHTGPIDFLCPVISDTDGLFSRIDFPIGKIYRAREFDIKSISGVLRAVIFFPLNMFLLFKAMRAANHIHLRCPGNIGLLACMVQIFYPSKKKTAKYAGNWDPKSTQPLSYRLQKWLLSNESLTRNMQVLVYGEWEGSSKNIKPFFTATYSESDKLPLVSKSFSPTIEFVYAGTLAPGKQPLYAVQLVEMLVNSGRNVRLRLFGEGAQRPALEDYISRNGLTDSIFLLGNQNSETLKTAYVESHFMILPSKSEGWPKVVAEAMFWGCLPVSTPVSCVPYMLGHGQRGILLSLDMQADLHMISDVIDSPDAYAKKVTEAANWSRQFTLDLFENEIRKLVI